jgi:hypothetical protein
MTPQILHALADLKFLVVFSICFPLGDLTLYEQFTQKIISRASQLSWIVYAVLLIKFNILPNHGIPVEFLNYTRRNMLHQSVFGVPLPDHNNPYH